MNKRIDACFHPSLKPTCFPRRACPPPASIRAIREWLGIAVLALAAHALIPPASAQFALTQIKSFCFEDALGSQPLGEVIEGSDGRLYGTTQFGRVEPGPLGATVVHGVVYRLEKDGSGYSVLHSFNGAGNEGLYPFAGVIEASDGVLYGTTLYSSDGAGGIQTNGTVFKLNRDGTAFSVLHEFQGTAGDGSQPAVSPLEGSDGALYGTTQYGGLSNLGTVFRINRDGSGFSLLHSFNAADGGGFLPNGALIEDREGWLYGTTFLGGATNGTVFKIGRDGSGFTVVHAFASGGLEGANPASGVLDLGDGFLHGTTVSGGASTNHGTVFRVGRDGGEFAVIHSFSGGVEDGSQPYGRLIEAGPDTLYGTTSLGGSANQGTVFKLNKSGDGYTVLRSLTGLDSDGAQPFVGLNRASNGRLYGTASIGGRTRSGTVFQIDPADDDGYTSIYEFLNGGDGTQPYSRLLSGGDGSFYGTTFSGGTRDQGVIYRLSGDGSNYSILREMAVSDGVNPYAGLIRGSNGLLYGTAISGGASNWGTIFSLNRDGSGFTVLHSFTGTSVDGAAPYGGLIESGGFLYGTTAAGGAANKGSVFRIGTNGAGFVIFRHLLGVQGDGATPYAGLLEGSDGFLYGTTWEGGLFGKGAVFVLNRINGAYAIRRHFAGGPDDGTSPGADLIEGSDGLLYGTTNLGGRTNLGTIFRLNKLGLNYEVIHHFMGGIEDGAHPAAGAGLIEGPDQTLYGTTVQGGKFDRGTVYRVNKDGSGFTVIHSFENSGDGGFGPYPTIAAGPDGALYGATLSGGALGCGTLFRIVPAGALSISQPGTLSLSGPAGFAFDVQYRDPLELDAPWLDLTNVLLSISPAAIDDPGSAAVGQRIYRATLRP